MSNAVPPSVTFPSPNEWLDTVQSISGITRDREANVTSTAHTFDSSDIGITSIMFKQVQGMLPINGMTGVIQSIVDADNFTVNINSTNFPIYRGSSGVVITLTGEPPTETQSFQTFNTPWQNIG